MKKLLLLYVAIATLGLTSCNDNDTKVKGLNKHLRKAYLKLRPTDVGLYLRF